MGENKRFLLMMLKLPLMNLTFSVQI